MILEKVWTNDLLKTIILDFNVDKNINFHWMSESPSPNQSCSSIEVIECRAFCLRHNINLGRVGEYKRSFFLPKYKFEESTFTIYFLLYLLFCRENSIRIDFSNCFPIDKIFLQVCELFVSSCFKINHRKSCINNFSFFSTTSLNPKCNIWKLSWS